MHAVQLYKPRASEVVDLALLGRGEMFGEVRGRQFVRVASLLAPPPNSFVDGLVLRFLVRETGCPHAGAL